MNAERLCCAALVSVVLALHGCAGLSEPGDGTGNAGVADAPKEWSAWSRWADAAHPVGDGRGHGPDVGSDEWAYALGRQLGVSDADGHGPDVGSDEWRRAVERKLAARGE